MDLAGLSPISMAGFRTDPGAFAAALRRDFEATGFAVIADHGLGQTAIDGGAAAARAFFAQPDAEKRRWHAPDGAGARGYTPFGVETAKGHRRPDLKEFWHVGRELPEGHRYRAAMPENLWPAQPPGFRHALTALYDGFDSTGRFEASQVLAKHDERYMPKEVVQALKKSGEWRPDGQAAGSAPAQGAS